MLGFFQGLRGEALLADTIVWFLCDGLLGYGCYVYRNTSGKTLVAEIRFLQKYLECVWWVCSCYTQMGEGTFFLLVSVNREATGCKEKLLEKEGDMRNIFWSSEYGQQQLKFILTGVLFVTNQKEKMRSARNYCRFLKLIYPVQTDNSEKHDPYKCVQEKHSVFDLRNKLCFQLWFILLSSYCLMLNVSEG